MQKFSLKSPTTTTHPPPIFPVIPTICLFSQSTDKRYGIAICGLGRAGSIHTGNCVRHPKVDIKYFVELDLSRAEQVKKEYGLVGTKVVHSNDFNTVLGKKTP